MNVSEWLKSQPVISKSTDKRDTKFLVRIQLWLWEYFINFKYLFKKFKFVCNRLSFYVFLCSPILAPVAGYITLQGPISNSEDDLWSLLYPTYTK